MSTRAETPRAALLVAILAGGVFALLAGLFKAIVFPAPAYNPPLIYPVVVAFALAAPLWFWLVTPSHSAVVRGGVVGAFVGAGTSLLIWPIYLLLLGLEQGHVLEVWAWSPIYAAFSAVGVAWYTALLGAATGSALAWAQRVASRTKRR